MVRSRDYLSGHSVQDYIGMVTANLAKDWAVASANLPDFSRMAYMDACIGALIRAHLAVLQDEFARLLEIRDEKVLKDLYTLLSRVTDGLGSLTDTFCKHVQREGQDAIAAIVSEGKTTDATLYVNSLAGVHERFINLVKQCFNGDTTFLAAAGKASFLASMRYLVNHWLTLALQACAVFVNRNAAAVQSQKSAELVVKFTDESLKRTGKASKAMEVDVAITRAVGAPVT